MIYKHQDYKNGYIFAPSSCDDDFQKILKSYDKVSCIICNNVTIRNFKTNGVTNPPITINNKLNDGVFFINATC